MRTFKLPATKLRATSVTLIKTAGVVLAMLLMLVAGPGNSTAQAQEFRSTEAAYEQGIQAYRAGYFEIAIPGLKYAAKKGSLRAKFYLARIYTDTSIAQTDHAAAYRLFYQIAAKNLELDAAVDPRAIYVAKSLTAVARYLRDGVPDIGVRANPRKAAVYLKHSAKHFGDVDAQYELAKLYLTGEGVRKDIGIGLHFLSVLTSQKGHAEAQAFLADLLWRGRYVKKNKAKALALITLAVANAPERERFWIEDIYQNIYCGTSRGVREQASGFVANWRNRYRGKILHPIRPRSADSPKAIRTCSNGEEVAPVERTDVDGWLRSTDPVVAENKSGQELGTAAMSASEALSGVNADAMTAGMQSSMSGFSLRNVGQTNPAR